MKKSQDLKFFQDIFDISESQAIIQEINFIKTLQNIEIYKPSLYKKQRG